MTPHGRCNKLVTTLDNTRLSVFTGVVRTGCFSDEFAGI